MQPKKPTLQDVAHAAGVSTATVSRCLSHPDKVKPDVCAAIRRTIQALGYVPHGAARALASRRSQTIGAVVPTIDNAIFSEAIQHLQRGLAKANYTLLIAQSNYLLEEEAREVHTLLSRGIDGLVLVGEIHHPDVFAAIEQQRIPYVNLWIYNPTSRYSCIGLDNVQAGRSLGKHLTDLHHHKIGVLSGILQDNDRAQQRLQGIRACVQEQGRQLPEDHIIECRYSAEQGKLGAHELLARHPDTTAIICGNDILALGALCAARERGLSVPEQLSITGFDNLEIISVLSPALTTIHVPSRQIGINAADYLIRQLETDLPQIERILLETDLIIRNTTGPARQATG